MARRFYQSDELSDIDSIRRRARNITIKLTHYDDTKKRARDSQIVRAKENIKLSYGVPCQRHALGTNQHIKALRH